MRERGGVRYRELQARSLVNRCTSPRMPFAWTRQPLPRLRDGLPLLLRDLHARVHGHHHAGGLPLARLRQDGGGGGDRAPAWRRVVRRGEEIALGTATDPYQPGEAQARVTRALPRAGGAAPRAAPQHHHQGRAGAARRRPPAAASSARSRLSVHISLISPDAELLRELEPWAPPPEVRLDVMRRLAEAGIDVWLGLAPVLPAPHRRRGATSTRCSRAWRRRACGA